MKRWLLLAAVVAPGAGMPDLGFTLGDIKHFLVHSQTLIRAELFALTMCVATGHLL